MKKALIFGASGFIGSYLLGDLLASPDYEQVTVVVRKDLGIKHAKLKVVIGDYQSLPSLKEDLTSDEVFIALGTTKKKIPDPKLYYQVDHDYPVLAAKLAQERGAKSIYLVSSIGADAKSSLFYIRTKGETERDIAALGFEHTHIFRPSMLLGHRKEHRPLEGLAIKVWAVIDPFLVGPLKSYRGIDGQDVARAMVGAAKKQLAKLKIYTWQEMQELL
jgi:uncharacterized protein YbjT (DUF2867 family)